MTDNITISQAVEGFLLDKEAERRSPFTIIDYRNSLRKFIAFLGNDPHIRDITARQVKRFFAEPNIQRLAKKSALNIHIALSSLWTWAVVEGYVDEHIIRKITPPKPEQRAINPYTENDVRAILKACEHTHHYTRLNCSVKRKRPSALRDKTMILLLLDTGMRAAELCGLTIGDVDIKNRRVKVLGKGSKERILQICATTAKSIWRYIAQHRHEARHNEPLFMNRNGRGVDRWGLLSIIRNAGERAGVRNCTVHRFRHTFAINFLRNGGNAYALQMALGHTTLEMVRKYLRLAQVDMEAAHQRASPVANWRL